MNGPLHETALTTPTQYLNDSCSVAELNYAIARGCIGATSNPVIVGNVLKKEMHVWRDHIIALAAAHPDWHEEAVAWRLYQDIAVHGSKLLLPLFEKSGGTLGRMSIQTDPRNHANAHAMFVQAVHFAALAPNMQVKIPCTAAGIAIAADLSALGVNLNITVSFCVPQVLAIGEAIERGLKRREAAGQSIANMRPFATMMVGRNDDWMKVLVKNHALDVPVEALEWAGVACFKRAYEIFQQRSYRTQLLSAAYRNFYHWTEFVGGAVSLTIPHEWQLKFNESNVRPEPRMHLPVAEAHLTALQRIPDFKRAYEPDGMSIAEFASFGATARTLRSFIEATHAYIGLARDVVLKNPDER